MLEQHSVVRPTLHCCLTLFRLLLKLFYPGICVSAYQYTLHDHVRTCVCTIYPFPFSHYIIQCMMYDSLMISVSFNIAYLFTTYRLFHSEMAEGHQRGRQPTRVSSSKKINL